MKMNLLQHEPNMNYHKTETLFDASDDNDCIRIAYFLGSKESQELFKKTDSFTAECDYIVQYSSLALTQRGGYGRLFE